MLKLRKLLLESSAQVDDCDYEDSTALMFAAGFGHAVNPETPKPLN